MQLLEFKNYIHNDFVSARNQATFPHFNPSTGEQTGNIVDSDLLDVADAIRAAHAAREPWQKLDADQRRDLFLRIAELLNDRKQVIALRQSIDQGTPIQYVLNESIPSAIGSFLAAAEFLKKESQRPSHKRRYPIGTVGLITPSSDPIAQLSARVAAALACGNTVVAKVSEFAPDSAMAFAEILLHAGLPAGVFNFLQGRGAQAGSAVAQHPGLSTLSASCSFKTAEMIARETSDQMKHLHLSIGSKNPVVVFAGVDLDKTAKQVADLAFASHPRVELKASRLLVQESIYQEFILALNSVVTKMKIGDATDPETQVGPLVHAKAKEDFLSAVNLAKSEKGKALFAGAKNDNIQQLPGRFVHPAFFYDFTLCSTLQQDEVPGPFMTSSSFKYQFDAVKHANNSDWGRAAYVFAPNTEQGLEQGRKTAEKIIASQIFVNSSWPQNHLFDHYSAVKKSGFGGSDSFESLVGFFSYRARTVMPEITKS